jgi:hypothetical protein
MRRVIEQAIQQTLRWKLIPFVITGAVESDSQAIGLTLDRWGFALVRCVRGPRRKALSMPKELRYRGHSSRMSKAVASAGTRRSNSGRLVAMASVLLIGGLTLSGCSSASWPDFMPGAASATPTPSVTAAVVNDTPPAVTVPQLRVILARISAVAAKADADKDVELAKTRFDGPALDLRAANYAIRKVDDTQAALAAIPADGATVILPQQQKADKWPRVVFTVVQDPTDEKAAPLGLMLEQQTPRSNYKVEYATALEAGAQLPKLAPEQVGAPRFGSDVKLLKMAPSKLALAYGEILEKGPTSETTKDFDTSNDKLIGLIGLENRKDLQAKVTANKGKLEFTNTVGPYDSISLGSNDSGAIVMAYLNETVTATPAEAGASVHPEGQVKSLSGVTGSTKGTVAVYGDQLLFYVPTVTSKQKISLLGFATGLTTAKELP